MELTKEYFDEQLKTLLTKQDAKNFATKTDLKPLVTKQDLEDGVEKLARMVNDGFEDMRSRLDVTGRVDKLEQTIERKFAKLEDALHLKL